jgi:hypothetical protein
MSGGKMHLLTMFVGYPAKIDEFLNDMRNRMYKMEKYSANRELDAWGNAKFREIRFYDVHFSEEIEDEIVSDLLTICYTIDGENKENRTIPTNHSFKFNLFRKTIGMITRVFGYEKLPEKYKTLRASGMAHCPNYYLMNGLILGKMKDPVVDNIEQV